MNLNYINVAFMIRVILNYCAYYGHETIGFYDILTYYGACVSNPGEVEIFYGDYFKSGDDS